MLQDLAGIAFLQPFQPIKTLADFRALAFDQAIAAEEGHFPGTHHHAATGADLAVEPVRPLAITETRQNIVSGRQIRQQEIAVFVRVGLGGGHIHGESLASRQHQHGIGSRCITRQSPRHRALTGIGGMFKGIRGAARQQGEQEAEQNEAAYAHEDLPWFAPNYNPRIV